MELRIEMRVLNNLTKEELVPALGVVTTDITMLQANQHPLWNKALDLLKSRVVAAWTGADHG